MFISKIKYPKEKILITLIYILVIFLMYIFNIRCVFISLFGIPCPGCGMTRAVISALNLNFSSAFSYHFMFWSLPIMYVYFLCDGNLFKNKKIDIVVWIAILSGFVIKWILDLALMF